MRLLPSCRALLGAGFLLASLPQVSWGTAYSLPDVVAVALKENSKIKNACDAILEAHYRMDVAEADFGLRFTANSGSGLGTDTQTSQATTLRLLKRFASGTDVELSAGNTSTTDGFYRSFSGITISQAILRGFGPLANTARVSDAARQILSSQRQFEITREMVLVDVVAAFYRIVEQKLVLNIATHAVERAREIVRGTEAKLDRGLATKSDVLRAESQASAAESARLDADEALANAKDQLRVLAGIDSSTAIDVTASLDLPAPTTTAAPGGDADQDPRLDVREAVDDVVGAELDVDVARRELLPDLRLGVNYSMVGTGDNFFDSLGLNDPTFRVIISSDMPLDRAAANARYNQAALDLDKKKRALEDLRRKTEVESRQAARHVTTVQRRLRLQQNDVVAARGTLDLVTLRFDRGYASNTEVLQAEQALTEAQRKEVELRIEQVGADLELRAASGSLSSFFESLLEHPLPEEKCSPEP